MCSLMTQEPPTSAVAVSCVQLMPAGFLFNHLWVGVQQLARCLLVVGTAHFPPTVRLASFV